MQRYFRTVRDLLPDDVCLPLFNQSFDDSLSPRSTTVIGPRFDETAATPGGITSLAQPAALRPSNGRVGRLSGRPDPPYAFCACFAQPLPAARRVVSGGPRRNCARRHHGLGGRLLHAACHPRQSIVTPGISREMGSHGDWPTNRNRTGQSYERRPDHRLLYRTMKALSRRPWHVRRWDGGTSSGRRRTMRYGSARRHRVAGWWSHGRGVADGRGLATGGASSRRFLRRVTGDDVVGRATGHYSRPGGFQPGNLALAELVRLEPEQGDRVPPVTKPRHLDANPRVASVT